MRDASPLTPRAARGSRHIVLLGAGHAHLQVLKHLAVQPLAATVVTLITPYSHQMVASMLPGFVTGRYSPSDFTIALQPLVQRAGLRWITQNIAALDATSQTLQLDDGSSLGFDLLSVNTLPTQDRARVEQVIPGAREHALFVHPLEAFVELWSRVTAMGDIQPLRITIIGAGAGGIELAFAVRQRLPNAAVTLLCGAKPPASRCKPQMQVRIVGLLKQRNITVLQDRAVAIKSGFVQLGCGADLACDVPLLATGTAPQPWLATSRLALDERGFIAVDTTQRSTSHNHVFASGDICSRSDQSQATCGSYDRLAGQTLTYNLVAAVTRGALKARQPPTVAVNLLACGDRYAVGSWGNYSFQGRWAQWLKDWIDRRLIE